MIESFEDHTHPLTDYELKTLLPLMIQGFTTKIGKTRAVTNAQICKALNNKGYDVNEPRIRKLVFYNFFELFIFSLLKLLLCLLKIESHSFLKLIYPLFKQEWYGPVDGN